MNIYFISKLIFSFKFFSQLHVTISLHVVVMVCAVMLGLANVMKGSTVTVAQVNIIIYYRYFAIFFAFADQGPLHLCWVLGVCSFNMWLISSQEEENVVISWANAPNDNYFTQNCQSCHFEWKLSQKVNRQKPIHL